MAKRSLSDLPARVLGAAQLARIVPSLAPETLHLIIQYAGLDACADLVAAATATQLSSVLDIDLWGNAAPGRDEPFDAARFGEWVEMLVEAGEAAAARTVAALDRRLVIAGLSRHVRVFDSAAVSRVETDDEWVDADGESSGLTCEVGGYVVRSRGGGSWDPIVALLVALDAGDPDCFQALMRGCRQVSNAGAEADGLDDLLAEPRQLLHDVALSREERRSRQGYITPADARAFLQIARGAGRPASGPRTPNPIAAAYLQPPEDLEPSSREEAVEPCRGEAAAMVDDGLRAAMGEVADLLGEAGLVPERPRALLAAGGDAARPLTAIRRLMEYLRDEDAAAYSARSRELAFVANALVAACSIEARPFTPQEASDAAVCTCNLGLEHWPGRWPRPCWPGAEAVSEPAIPVGFLRTNDLVTAFEIGWTVLHEDVSLFVAETLVGVLGDLACSDAETQLGLHVLRRRLAEQYRAGTPWLARDALDVLATLDVPAWAALLGLLGECPVAPAVLGAILEGRKGAVSATNFDFIATRGHLAQVRDFAARLPGILAP